MSHFCVNLTIIRFCSFIKKNSLEQVIPSIVPFRIENELSVYFIEEMCTKIKMHFNFTRKLEVFSIFEILVNPRV